MAEQEKSAKKGKNEDVTTLRGVCRMAKSGTADWAGPKVRTKAGYMVTARIRSGQVEVMEHGEGWVEYPKEGKNVDPDWRPTPSQKGFTLVELLITIVIVAIFAAVIGVFVVIGVWACKGCDMAGEKIDQATSVQCIQACAELEGEEAEAACLERCD